MQTDKQQKQASTAYNSIFYRKIYDIYLKTESVNPIDCNKIESLHPKTSHTPPRKAGYATIRRAGGRFCHMGIEFFGNYSGRNDTAAPPPGARQRESVSSQVTDRVVIS